MRYERAAASENRAFVTFRAIVIGTLAGAVICLVLLMIGALGFVSSKHIPQSVVSPVTIAVSAIGAIFAGYVTARILRVRGMLYGVLSGLLLYLLLFIAGVAAAGEALTVVAFIKLLVMALSGAVGGILAVNKKSRRN